MTTGGSAADWPSWRGPDANGVAPEPEEAVAWADAEGLIRETVDQLLAPYGVDADVHYVRGVPPVVNSGMPSSTVRAAR